MKSICIIVFFTVLFSAFATNPLSAQDEDSAKLWVEYQPDSNSNGKRIVLISGDEEYRSEEALPMLGQILAKHHGFKCTVLFAINPETGEIDPNNQQNIPGIEQVKSADLIIMALRFRNLPDDDMAIIDDYLKAGKPVLGLRTSTHAFRMSPESKFKHYTYSHKEWRGGFGQQVLGDTWISHHGGHKVQSTRGIIDEENAEHIVLKGVDDVWGNTDVYGIRNLTDDATILLHGQVLEGMKPTDKPVEDELNDPMMPLAWFKSYQLDEGESGLAFCTTMGSSTDLESEGLRRLIVNATFHLLGMDDLIDGKANVDYVSEFEPRMYGFDGFEKGLKPSDFALEK